jgi:tetratricopeptide (TPR) repeat protein
MTAKICTPTSRLISVAACALTMVGLTIGTPANAEETDELLQQAAADRAAGKLDSAAFWLRSAIRQSPNLAKAHYQLGLIYLQQNKDALAKAALLRAAALDPSSDAKATISKYADRLSKVQPDPAYGGATKSATADTSGDSPSISTGSTSLSHTSSVDAAEETGASIAVAPPSIRPGAKSAAATSVAPAASAAPRPRAATSNAAPADQPAPARVVNGKPVGLFYMQRMWIATHSLEKAVWYFSPDGKVYENLATGFSAADLAAHHGRKGTYKVSGDTMSVTWSDATTSSSKVEPDQSSNGFAWDMGLFTAVPPFTDTKKLAGKYEGGTSVGSGGNLAMVSSDLELRADGTYTMGSASSISATSDRSTVTVGGQGDNTGTWSASGYSLTLTDSSGKAMRKIGFPWDDDKTPVYPDYLFWGGTMFKKQK